ncbi:MAG: hypothetical protein JW925_02760 [Syntrophaceae bacterium]|nr:hypothetical protein [Syntrophaceae bacterium]
MQLKAQYEISSFMNDGIPGIILTGTRMTNDADALQVKVTDIVEAAEAEDLLVDSRNLLIPP